MRAAYLDFVEHLAASPAEEVLRLHFDDGCAVRSKRSITRADPISTYYKVLQSVTGVFREPPDAPGETIFELSIGHADE